MQNLNSFIQDNNRYIEIFGKKGMKFPLSQKDCDDLARTIDCQLSPENLHCDGEISNAEAGRKYRFLVAVAQELEQYAQHQGYDIPAFYEL